MTRHLWSAMAPALTALLILMAVFFGLILASASLPVALMLGWLVSGGVSLAMGAWRRSVGWAALGLTELGGALTAALIWQDVLNWWWPLGLVALGVAYVPLAALLPGQSAASWRAALESSAPFVAGVGAVWELGQVILAYIFASQGIPLLAGDANALHGSFVISSLLLFVGSLLWALLRRRLLPLALTAILTVQLAVALVLNATAIGDPSTGELLALTLLVVALTCHAGAYPLRLWLPDLAPAGRPAIWRLLTQRRGWMRATLALKASNQPEAWGLCILLDSFSLVLCLLAILPIADQSTAQTPNGPPLTIILSAGVLLTISIAYWQNTPWLLALAGSLLAGDLYLFGLFAIDPSSAWPLLYFAATSAVLGAAILLKDFAGRSWARPGLLVAIGFGCLALAFALKRQSIPWELGTALALVVAALLAFWGWQMGQAAH